MNACNLCVFENDMNKKKWHGVYGKRKYMDGVGQNKYDILDTMIHKANVLGIMAVLCHDWVPGGSRTDIDLNVLVSGQHRVA